MIKWNTFSLIWLWFLVDLDDRQSDIIFLLKKKKLSPAQKFSYTMLPAIFVCAFCVGVFGPHLGPVHFFGVTIEPWIYYPIAYCIGVIEAFWILYKKTNIVFLVLYRQIMLGYLLGTFIHL